MKRFSNINNDIADIVNIYKSTTSRLNYSNQKKENNQENELESSYFVDPESNHSIVQEYKPSFSFFNASVVEKKEEPSIIFSPIKSKSVELNTSSESAIGAFEQCVSDEEDEKIAPEKYNSLEKNIMKHWISVMK